MAELSHELSACWWWLLVKLYAMNNASPLQAIRKLAHALERGLARAIHCARKVEAPLLP
jgi:hypothetical protein